MTSFLTLVFATFLARFGYQMARSPVLPRFAQDLQAPAEAIDAPRVPILCGTAIPVSVREFTTPTPRLAISSWVRDGSFFSRRSCIYCRFGQRCQGRKTRLVRGSRRFGRHPRTISWWNDLVFCRKLSHHLRDGWAPGSPAADFGKSASVRRPPSP